LTSTATQDWTELDLTPCGKRREVDGEVLHLLGVIRPDLTSGGTLNESAVYAVESLHRVRRIRWAHAHDERGRVA